MKHVAGSFASLHLHICNLQVRVAVPSPVLCLVPVLDCLDRAKVDTGATVHSGVAIPACHRPNHYYVPGIWQHKYRRM